jgi:N-acetylmuramoyl-L-alanine amidase
MKNQLLHLVIHCTATPEGKAFSKEDIIRWHTSPVEKGGRGWKHPGYADVIYLDGQLINIVPYDENNIVDPWEVTNGAPGLNGNSRHVVYVGGMDKENKHPKDTRTLAQRITLEGYVRKIIRLHPSIQILGHNQAPGANGRACPSFDVPEWLRSFGVAEENIYKEQNYKPAA